MEKKKNMFPKDWIYAYDPKGAINGGKIYSARWSQDVSFGWTQSCHPKDATADKVIAKLQDALYQNDVMDAKKKTAAADSAAAALGL